MVTKFALEWKQSHKKNVRPHVILFAKIVF